MWNNHHCQSTVDTLQVISTTTFYSLNEPSNSVKALHLGMQLIGRLPALMTISPDQSHLVTVISHACKYNARKHKCKQNAIHNTSLKQFCQYLEYSWKCYCATIANYCSMLWGIRSTILARAWLLVLYKSVDSYPFILYTVMFPGLVDLNYSEFFDEQNYEIIQIIQNTPWKCPRLILCRQRLLWMSGTIYLHSLTMKHWRASSVRLLMWIFLSFSIL